jgi:phage terminase large subunit
LRRGGAGGGKSWHICEKRLYEAYAYLLADLVNTRQIRVTNESESERQMLIEELEQIKSKDSDKDGKRKIQPKDEVKRAIGRSPDYGDCFIMRMFFELQKPVG